MTSESAAGRDVGCGMPRGKAPSGVARAAAWWVLAAMSVVGGAALAEDATGAAGHVRVAHGAFSTRSEARSFERALAKAFGSPFVITHEDPTTGEGADFDRFASAVALDGDTALVGAPQDNRASGMREGSAYVFVRSGGSWTLQAKLAVDAGSFAHGGAAVALSGDTAVVGAHGAFTDLGYRSGVAYVFVRSGTAWTRQAVLAPDDGADDDSFGAAVAVVGDTVLVGAPTRDAAAGANAGGAYVFTRAGATWSKQATLLAPSAAAGDLFGRAVALAGETAVIGAPGDDTPAGSDAGSAQVFTRSGTTWDLQDTLAAATGAAGDMLGTAVSLDATGDTALLGAPQSDTAPGAAFVFTRNGTIWSEQARLSAGDGMANDEFGSAVVLAADTALVGARLDDTSAGTDAGSSRVFTRSGTSWTERTTLVPAGGAAGNRAGFSVALSETTALIGSPLADLLAGNDAGIAHVFDGGGASWTASGTLDAGNGAEEDYFGYDVAISGDTAVVGIPNDDPIAGHNAGSAIVYVRDDDIWSRQATLTASDGTPGSRFGWSVAVSGDTALIGAPRTDTAAGADAGAAYVFTRSGTSWSQQAKLLADDAAAGDTFGWSVATVGDMALIGAPKHDRPDVGFDAGSAYVFTRSGSSWSAPTKIVATTGAIASEFGSAVALGTDTVLISAPSGGVTLPDFAEVFGRDGSAWVHEATLTSDAGPGDDDGFGFDVALDGTTALVGAYIHDRPGSPNQAGAAFVFVRDGGTWPLQRKLTASDAAAGDEFGYAVAIAGNTAVVGAPYRHSFEGAAYVFERTGTSWAEQPILTAGSGAEYQDFFGTSVALGAGAALITMADDDSELTGNPDVGSVYAFRTEFAVAATAGPNGVISPAGTWTVAEGDVVAFTVTPAAGHSIDAVTGCGGSLVGTTYTTAPIASDCTVAATFDRNPTVSSSTRLDFDPTPGPTVRYAVAFSEPVSGVDATDFLASTTGTLAGSSIMSVSGSDAAYVVVVSTGVGAGTLRLDLIDDDSIRDLGGRPLGGSGAGTGTYADGATYNVDPGVPFVLFRDGFESDAN